MRVLVDADALAYSCGFASQSVVYDWSYTKDGEILEEGITADKTYLPFLELERPMGAEMHVVPIVEAEPLENALGLVKRSILGIENALEHEDLEFRKMELFLTGKGNFREGIATIKKYKGNRDKLERPFHWAAIRRYMTERWGAVTVEGKEADDILASIAHSEGYDPHRVLIVSMDKDLMTVPGRLYNFRRKKFYFISPQEALVNFYRQCLTGDTVDNIGGCFKCGPKTAEELVQREQTEEQMYLNVLHEYERSLERKGCPYKELGAADALLENARLLHMQRWEGDVWEPPGKREGGIYLPPSARSTKKRSTKTCSDKG